MNVIHGDVRAENILIGKGEKVWIVDFEFTEILNGDEVSDDSDTDRLNVEGRICQENESIRYLLSIIQSGSEAHGNRNRSKIAS